MSHTPPYRPTTPLRPSSRTSLRSSTNAPAPSHSSPLDTLEPQFAELADSLSDLESNLLHLQLMHESLSRFSENFAAFLYGLEMNAFVVDWPEQPLVESIQRWRARQAQGRGVGEDTGISTLRTPTKASGLTAGSGNEVDSTILSDTTFASLKATPARRRTTAAESEGGKTSLGRGRAGGAVGTAKKSGIPARSGSASGRGARGGTTGRASALPTRGRGRATGVR